MVTSNLNTKQSIWNDPITGGSYSYNYDYIYSKPLILRLKELRTDPSYGMEATQEKFARLLGVNVKTLSRIESGTTPLTDEMREKYMSVFYLFPDAGKPLFYLPDAFAEEIRADVSLVQSLNIAKSNWFQRLHEKIVGNFNDLTSVAKDFIESSTNFAIQQCVTKEDLKTGLPTFPNASISMRTMSGWKWGTKHLESYLQKEVWTKLKVKYNRFRVVRGLGYQVGTKSFMDYEIYTAGATPGSSNYIDSLPPKFVTQTKIDSVYMHFQNPELNPEMTTAGVKILDQPGDRQLTIFLHYDSYKDKDGKKMKQQDFFDSIMDDLEHTIIPTIEEYLLERDNRYMESIRELGNARSQIIMSEGE